MHLHFQKNSRIVLAVKYSASLVSINLFRSQIYDPTFISLSDPAVNPVSFFFSDFENQTAIKIELCV